MLLRVDPQGGPLYKQIHAQIRAAVLDGRLAPGARLPATRSLADELGVSRTVVLQAYEWLQAEGYLSGRVGAGTFVSRRFRPPTPEPREPRAASPPRLSDWARDALRAPWRQPPEVRYDFRYGHLDPATFPRSAWSRALSRAARAQDPGYSEPAGSRRLRSALVDYLGRSRGVRCAPDHVILVTGSQQALDLVTRVLVEPGDRVLVEDPGYPGATAVFGAARARLVHTPVDDQGIDPATLDVHDPVRLAYVTPSHQFPSGAILPAHRRVALLEWAERVDAFVLEDDYDSEYRYGHPPIEAVQALDAGRRVLYLGTFSKTLSPALRVGYLVVPDELVDAFRAAKWMVDRHSPTLEQEALARFLEEGGLERHVRRVRAAHGQKRDALLEALDRHVGEGVEVTGESAGIHVVAWLRDVTHDGLDALVAAARERDVGLHPVTRYYREPPPRAGLLMGYSMSRGDIDEGVRRFADALDEVAPRRRRVSPP